MALQIVDQRINGAAVGNALAGFNTLINEAPQHFKLILDKPVVTTTTLAMPENLYVQKYVVLPGLAMYFAGQWIVNLNYWGCNQYITQRALGARQDSRCGILFAGFLKLLMPVIVMLPGIAAYVLYTKGHLLDSAGERWCIFCYFRIFAFWFERTCNCSTYSCNCGISGGKVNSISTIFTLDIYKKYIKQMQRKFKW
jgi:SSS family solute:Na+ symporter